MRHLITISVETFSDDDASILAEVIADYAEGVIVKVERDSDEASR